MIKINLLPTEFRLAEEKKSHLSPQPIAMGVFFIILIITLLQFFIYLGIRGKLHKLDLEMSHIGDSGHQADQLSQIVNSKLLPEKKFFDKYIIPNILMSEIMNELSNLIPDSIWLQDAHLRRDFEQIRIEMNGCSKITSKQIAVAQIQEYVNLVRSKIEEILNKANPNAPQEVKVTLTTNLRDTGGIEAMQFVVIFQSSLIAKK